VLIALSAFAVSILCVVVVSTVGSGGSSSSTTSTGSEPIVVTLSEFKITPATITAPPGPVKLLVSNSGSMTHNLSVSGGGRTPDIKPGGSAPLDLGSMKEGTYQVQCNIPGHADSGMKATLVIAKGATATAAGGGGSSSMAGMAGMASAASGSGDSSDNPSPADYAAMDQKMADGMKAGLATFTAGNATQGVGNQKLAPTIEADGTKVFNLEASIIDWQVGPGKTVKAWAYNGQVPGPWIRTEPNDHVKVVIKNSLPVSTDIHFHGITTPFPDDGVSPLTQDPIKPGDTYTYEWTNPNHPELGMYHAHDMGQIGVLNGLFAVFQSGDVPLPAGKTIDWTTLPTALKPTQELPIVLNDAGTIGLSLNGKAYPATAPVEAKPGDVLLVHYYNEGLQSHPMHLHHIPQLVVAKDGFPLEQPYYADTINVAPGERYSVLIMPGAQDVGVWAWHCHILAHAENDSGLYGMVTALIVDDPNKPKS
jgi:FtsP/CotA-like multicopper oxidase with cupredoxin domain/plastocyanin